MKHFALKFNAAWIAWCAFFAGWDLKAGDYWTATIMGALCVVMWLFTLQEARQQQRAAREDLLREMARAIPGCRLYIDGREEIAP